MIGRTAWVGWETQASIYGANVQHLHQKVRCPSPPIDVVVMTGVRDTRSGSSEPQDTRCSSSESQDRTRWSSATSTSARPRPSFFRASKTVPGFQDDGALPEASAPEISRESTPQRRPSKEDNPAYNACCLNKTPLRYAGDSLVTGSGSGVVVLSRHDGEHLPHLMGLPGKTGRRRMSLV